jgi:hypothetical protein
VGEFVRIEALFADEGSSGLIISWCGLAERGEVVLKAEDFKAFVELLEGEPDGEALSADSAACGSEGGGGLVL